MNSNIVNFNQLLCTQISEDGREISNIFDTLVVEKQPLDFSIVVFCSQILANNENPFTPYYYRIVLRYLADEKAAQKSYRIDTGVLWAEKDGIPNQSISSTHRCTHQGSGGKLAINCTFTFPATGSYELAFYTCPIESYTSQSEEEYNQKSIKELHLSSLAPFQVIIK